MNDHSKIPQVDHLILLVGGNPLPNAVAGKLLAKPNSTMTLIHSEGEHGTFLIAQNLQRWFIGQGFAQPAILRAVRESHADSIIQAVQAALKNTSRTTAVGLHYTGGTKTMAVHAYRVVEAWAKKENTTPSYTYLDARTLSLIVDPLHPEQGEPTKQKYVGRDVPIELKDLLALHGWSWREPPATQPFLPQISEALHRVYLDDDARTAWETWKREVLVAQCGREGNPDKWKSQGQLKEIKLPWPADEALQNLAQAVQQELGNGGSELNLADATKRCRYKEIEKVCKWLRGGYWLETAVLQALRTSKQQCHLHDISMNLLPRLPDSPPKSNVFEFDVVALRGYQLFAFSCGTDTDNETSQGGRERLKVKLVEAYVRARQIGGDEARVALVCCAEKPKELEREMYRALDAEGRIKVFGQQHLANLSENIKTWIEEQSQEEV